MNCSKNNNMGPLISVIIPVYNAEKTIRRTLDSIREQTFYDFEVIMIDDGSTDTSGDICDEYTRYDKRFKVKHKQNQGVSAARQDGIDMAKGEYTIHIDPDDWVEQSMLKELYLKAVESNADMVICDYRELTHDGEVYRKQEPSILTGVVVLNEILCGKLYGALWNKMMRREWLMKTKASFPQELTMREDLIFLSQCLPYAQKIAYIAKAYYGYERRNTSALTSNYLNESPSYYDQESLWVSLILKNKSLSNSIRLQLERYYFKLSYITLLKGLFDKQLWNERFKSHENLLDYGSGFRRTIVSFAFCDHFRIAQFMRTIISKIKS